MPTKSARVSTEYYVNTMRIMEHYIIYTPWHCHKYMKVKSVMLKLENDLDCLYERQVSFSCMSYHMAQKCQLEK
jgi:hypothetical protein